MLSALLIFGKKLFELFNGEGCMGNTVALSADSFQSTKTLGAVFIAGTIKAEWFSGSFVSDNTWR